MADVGDAQFEANSVKIGVELIKTASMISLFNDVEIVIPIMERFIK